MTLFIALLLRIHQLIGAREWLAMLSVAMWLDTLYQDTYTG